MTLPKPPDLTAALLKVLLNLGGEGRPKQVYPAITAAFPDITPSDLARKLQRGGSYWENQVQWARQVLVDEGLVDRTVRGVWKLTQTGNARARGNDADLTLPKRPEAKHRPSPPRVAPPTASPVAMRSVHASIVNALQQSQYASSRPAEFEEAIVDAFMFLGFEAHHIGGSGETDILAIAPLGIHRYTLVIDAKTTGRGRISEAQINFLAIDEHRRQRAAEHAVVIGPDFAGGNLLKNAETFRITLLTTAQLISIIDMHDTAPFTLDDLKSVFERGTLVDSKTLNELHVINQRISRSWAVMGLLVDQIATWSRQEPGRILAHPAALFATLRGKDSERLIGISPEEINDALAVLSSSAVGILGYVKNGVEGYVLTTSSSGARQRLLALAEQTSHAMAPVATGKIDAAPQSIINNPARR